MTQPPHSIEGAPGETDPLRALLNAARRMDRAREAMDASVERHAGIPSRLDSIDRRLSGMERRLDDVERRAADNRDEIEAMARTAAAAEAQTVLADLHHIIWPKLRVHVLRLILTALALAAPVMISDLRHPLAAWVLRSVRLIFGGE